MERFPSNIDVPSGRFELRRYTSADAAALGRAVAASLDHLRPWMPWADDEPITTEARHELLATWDREWGDGESAVYGMFDGPVVIGGCGLHRRRPGSPGVVEIGYWVHVDHIRRGIATEAAAALTFAAFSLPGTAAVEIHHLADNLASRAVPARLGYRPQPSEPLERSDGVVRTMCVWRVTRDEWYSARPPG